MSDEIDKAFQMLNAATPEELAEWIIVGTFEALAEAKSQFAQNQPGAKKAVRAATQELLEKFTYSVLNGETPDSRLIQFVAGQYDQVIDGGDARSLFPHLPYKANDPIEARNNQLAMEVELLRREDRDNLSLDRAIVEVVDRHQGLSEDNLRKIHRQHSAHGWSMANRDRRKIRQLD